MKRILFLASILLSTITSTAQEDRRVTLAESNLQGAVRSTSDITYDGVEKFGELEKRKKIAKSYMEFNKAGYLQQSLDENYKHEFKMGVKNKFDNKNNIIEQRSEEDGEVMTVKVKYNANDKEEEMNIYDEKGKLIWRYKTEYAAENVDLNSPNSNLFNTTEVYNGDGDLEKRISFIRDFSMTTNFKKKGNESYYAERDSKDNIIRTIRRENDLKDSTVYTYKYNSKNQKVEQVYFSKNFKKPATYQYEYDQYGNITKDTDSYGNIRTYTYTYDSQNNWIKRIERKLSFGEKTIEITERTIKYY